MLATVVLLLATSAHWEVTTIHDLMDREGAMVSNAVTIRRVDEGDGVA